MLPTGSAAPSSTNKLATATDISTLNTEKVTNLSAFFHGCRNYRSFEMENT